MVISQKAREINHVSHAVAVMVTPMNKGILADQGLITAEIETATPGDLALVVVTDTGDEADADAALNSLMILLERKPTSQGTGSRRYRTIASAATDNPTANLALVSVNGAYAAQEAHKALSAGLNVMLFSDNVPLEDEIALKRRAHSLGLLVMGPDCGTAIVNGTSLCFANKIRRGNIGIVAASGTGAQELSVRIHDFTGGVSQLLGTGGRDLSRDVGAIMTLDSIAALDADPETDVIVVISKPPDPAVAEAVLNRLKESPKSAVACFLGVGPGLVRTAGALGIPLYTRTKPAALAAVAAAGIPTNGLELHELNWPLIEQVRAKLGPEQKYIRGLYCGGSLCDEALHIALEHFDDVYSNVQTDPDRRLTGVAPSKAHTFIDLGDDEFTNGTPHPMIDPTARGRRFMVEAADPTVGVIVMDFILGYGAHQDPVGMLLPSIVDAKRQAVASNRHLEIIGYVLGTPEDPQGLLSQITKLADAGVTWASSSTNAGLLAREFVRKPENGDGS
jgi:succinyl-CoA synthetase alpha subunit